MVFSYVFFAAEHHMRHASMDSMQEKDWSSDDEGMRRRRNVPIGAFSASRLATLCAHWRPACTSTLKNTRLLSFQELAQSFADRRPFLTSRKTQYCHRCTEAGLSLAEHTEEAKQFRAKRAAHYNEGKNIALARELLKKEMEELDKDE
jgi:hypothetical protein